MPEGPVVCDTGPLIALSLIDHLQILQQLFGRVLVPRAVLDEVSAGGGQRPGSQAILSADWFEILDDVKPDPLLATELGAGEAAAITGAYEVEARLVLLDDRKARRIATSAYRLRVIGSAGILVFAKRAGAIPAVLPLLDAMVARGYYLSRRLVDQAAVAAGEATESAG
jgi:predicted nucleic acid-binding protein